MDIEIIKHSDILFKDVIRVAKIKSTAWPHPIESQLKWIIDNQTERDYHVILCNDAKEDIAYLDICPVNSIIDGKEKCFWGIGNVCTKHHGLGHGGHLIESVNLHLIKNNMPGLLFCKKNLIEFYLHYGWQLIPKEKINIVGHSQPIYTMCYNVPLFNFLEYKGFLF